MVPNFDQVERLHHVLHSAAVKPRLHKVKAHQKLTVDLGYEELWHAVGNTMADYVATESTSHLGGPLQAELRSQALESMQDLALLRKHLEFRVTLSRYRTQCLDAQYSPKEDDPAESRSALDVLIHWDHTESWLLDPLICGMIGFSTRPFGDTALLVWFGNGSLPCVGPWQKQLILGAHLLGYPGWNLPRTSS